MFKKAQNKDFLALEGKRSGISLDNAMIIFSYIALTFVVIIPVFMIIYYTFWDGTKIDFEMFKTVLFHGLVRDSQGRKMSKSLGNGIDPLEIIADYGADALRMTLITGNAPGNDMRFSNSRVEASRNFANKVWNASRFIMMNMPEDGEIPEEMPAGLLPEDKWILSGFNNVVRDVTDNMDRFELGIAVQKVHDFIWDEFCDWYIEMVKPRLYETKDAESHTAALWTLQTVLQGSLKLLHPYMPFVTEEIYQNSVRSVDPAAPESIHLCLFPEADETHIDKELEESMDEVLRIVVMGRACRNASNIKNRQPIAQMFVKAAKGLDAFYQDIIKNELNVKKVNFTDDVREFTSYTFKPQLRTVGPKYGKQLGGIRKYLAELDGKMLGFLVFYDYHWKSPWLGIALREDAKGMHLGTRLMAFAESYAREHGKGAIILTTHKDNVRGQALYKKSGYTYLGIHTTGELLYIRYFEDK